MAGDWIKAEENLPDKPEVWQIASILKLDGDTVVGKLIRVWVWASRNCNSDGVTSVTVLPLLDRCANVSGFAAAMEKVGWLKTDGTYATFPNFDRHCSQTAKDRANTNRRVSKHRLSRNANAVTDVTEQPLQKPLPEKRREDIQNTPIVPKGTPKGALQLRAEAIFKRKPETPLTAAESRAFKKNAPAIEATSDADWLALEHFYSLPQSETFARKDLATLVNNWNGEIDRAKAFQVKPPSQPPQERHLKEIRVVSNEKLNFK